MKQKDVMWSDEDFFNTYIGLILHFYLVSKESLNHTDLASNLLISKVWALMRTRGMLEDSDKSVVSEYFQH